MPTSKSKVLSLEAFTHELEQMVRGRASDEFLTDPTGILMFIKDNATSQRYLDTAVAVVTANGLGQLAEAIRDMKVSTT